MCAEIARWTLCLNQKKGNEIRLQLSTLWLAVSLWFIIECCFPICCLPLAISWQGHFHSLAIDWICLVTTWVQLDIRLLWKQLLWQNRATIGFAFSIGNVLSTKSLVYYCPWSFSHFVVQYQKGYASFSDVGESRVWFASKNLTPCRMH